VPTDAVLVVTNCGRHEPVILEALRHGKYVLVEKPMVTSIVEADDIAAGGRTFHRHGHGSNSVTDPCISLKYKFPMPRIAAAYGDASAPLFCYRR
jgi:hypothetical protein